MALAILLLAFLLAAQDKAPEKHTVSGSVSRPIQTQRPPQVVPEDHWLKSPSVRKLRVSGDTAFLTFENARVLSKFKLIEMHGSRLHSSWNPRFRGKLMITRLVLMFGSLAALAFGADDGGTRNGLNPPVLLHSEPPDSAIVKLPGPPPEPAASAGIPDAPRPFLRRATREYPPGFEEDSPKFLQTQIGQWNEFDSTDLLGKPLRRRQSFDDSGRENGVIYAYADPTGRYKEFELDFGGDTGQLRTVFVYPPKMTWQACRQVYGASVTQADAAQGRKFYSYLNRRLDVLVDASGKVISLGFY